LGNHVNEKKKLDLVQFAFVDRAQIQFGAARLTDQLLPDHDRKTLTVIEEALSKLARTERHCFEEREAQRTNSLKSARRPLQAHAQQARQEIVA
jgi:hypothetical protein